MAALGQSSGESASDVPGDVQQTPGISRRDTLTVTCSSFWCALAKTFKTFCVCSGTCECPTRERECVCVCDLFTTRQKHFIVDH